MDSVQVLFALVLVLAVGIQSGSSIRCLDCNSGAKYDGAKCDDPLDPEEAKSFEVDCDVLGAQRSINYTYCRKMHQSVEGENRVLRMCATKDVERLDRCVERTGTKKIKMKYCLCIGDKCNTASSTLAINIVLLTTISALLALLLHS